jgi:predicted metal-binding protein
MSGGAISLNAHPKNDPSGSRVSSLVGGLVDLAMKAGATGAGIVDCRDIVVDDDLAQFCRHPGCENFGLCANCPPHTAGPAGFRKLLEDYRFALFFKIEVPAQALLSDRKGEVFRTLQTLAATVEQSAIHLGCTKAKAFAGGSCKTIFCGHHLRCRVLDGLKCRYPDEARPSMSGFGIDVSRLMMLCGWQLVWPDAAGSAKTGTACALVLVD